MHIGSPIPLLEAERYLRGDARFVADIHLPGMVEAAILRSPLAHAHFTAVNPAPALALPGVLGVYTAADFGLTRTIPMRLGASPGLTLFLQLPIAADKVRYVGEPVAVVVAQDRYIAEDALELVEVGYEPLEAVSSISAALGDQAPLLFPGHGSNLAETKTIEAGDVDAALAKASHVFTERFEIGRHTAVPLETRGLVAHYEADRGRLLVWGPTKVPHFNRLVLADLLGRPESTIRFIEPDVGGGFGVRGEFYPEDFLIPALALRLRRPIRWIEDRREHLVATNHSRQQEHRITLALDDGGTILALLDEFWCDMGAYVRTHGNLVPACTAAFFTGPYRIPAYRSIFHCVLTNKTPTGTYRAPGRYEANFVRERMFDHVAGRLGMDPIEFRQRHLLRPADLPYDVGTSIEGMPVILDPTDYPRLFAIAVEEGQREFDRLAGARANGTPGGPLRWGLGFACFTEKTGPGPYEFARIVLDRSGQVVLGTGATNMGQGIETTLAQVVAERLQIPPGQVRVIHGDTDQVPYGVGSFASRSAVMAGNAAAAAADALRGSILRTASELLEAAEVDLEHLSDGRLFVRGSPDRIVTLSEIARAATGRVPMSAESFYSTNRMTFAGGAQAAVVAVDVETGTVRVAALIVVCDVGRMINPMIVRGQIAGGAAQGIGGALLEELRYDETGQPLSGTFMDYLLPTVKDVPDFRIRVLEIPAQGNPLGVRGCGEVGIAATGAALAAAVEAALREDGVLINRLPIRPEDVLLTGPTEALGSRAGTGVGAEGDRGPAKRP